MKKAFFIGIMAAALTVGYMAVGSMPGATDGTFVSSADAMGSWHPNQPRDHRPTGGGTSRVPEPSTLMMIGSGVAAAGAYIAIKRRNRK